MSAKISFARARRFLKAVRETGNQTIAAERARASRAWVQLQRSTDPQFKADVAAAVAAAKAALCAGRARRRRRRGGGISTGWSWWCAVEQAAGAGRAGAAAAVDAARRGALHRVPEATCNVRAACAAAGLSVASAYKHRERRPGFAMRWAGAIVEGQPRLVSALTAGAIALLDPEIPADEELLPPLEPMNVDHAIAVAMLYERRLRRAREAEERLRRDSARTWRTGAAPAAA